MEIYFNGTKIDLDISDNSYRYRVIMGENSLTVYFSLPEYLDIPKGAYCTYQAEKFTLTTPPAIVQKGEREYDYTLIFEAEQYKLQKYKFRNIIDRRLKFSYTAKPHEHLQLLIDNLNMRDSGWKMGQYIEAVEACISYNHNFCDEALKMMADTFKTEFEIDGKTIHLRKVEYNKENPLVLSYGRGGGFKTGIKRDNSDESEPVEILFIQGGEKNIDPSKYGSKELLLPKNQQLVYEGRTYVVDSDGFSIRRADKELQTGEENSLDCSNISPRRVGVVSNLIVTNADKHLYDFVDKDIPENLDYNKYTIKGEKLTVIFQSGMLAGEKTFEVVYKHRDRKFEIVPQDIDGVTMPDEIFKPVIGDKYAVFGCMLPDEYVCDNATQTGASWEMFREGAKFLYENEDPRFSFTGELDGIWTKKDWLNIGGKIVLGGYTRFTASFVPDGILIRIKGIKDFLSKPYSPVIELSNTTASVGVSGELKKIGQNEVVAEDNKRELINFTKRRFRDAQETTTMLQEALLNFSGSVNPVTVSTMQLLLGDESLQFRFVNGRTNPDEINHTVSYNSNTKVLTASAGVIQHMTLGINSLSSSHDVSEYKFWDMEAFNSPVLATSDKKYYLYAKVSERGSTGIFYLSESAIKMEAGDGYYYLLMGVLNSEFENDRSYTSLYGYSELLPGRLTIKKIVSPDGKTYFDIQNGEIVGDKITFLTKKGEKRNLSDFSEAIDSNFSDLGKSITSLEYLKEGFVNETSIEGGVVATSVLKLGAKQVNGVWKEKAGVNGAGEGDSTVRFYSGGDLDSAIRLVNNTVGAKASYVVTEKGKLYARDADITGRIVATDGEFTGLVKSNKDGYKIELNPNLRALIMSSPKNDELAKFWFNDNNAMLLMKYVDSDGSANTNMNLSAMMLHMSMPGYGRTADFGPMGIIHTGLLKGKTNEGFVNAYQKGTFLADTGQNSNGWAMLRVKIE